MARQDINMDPVCGEVNLTDNLVTKLFYPFIYLEDYTHIYDWYYAFFEIVVPEGFEKKYNEEVGFNVHIPYMADERFPQIRFRVETPIGSIEYDLQRYERGSWLSLKEEKSDGSIVDVPLCSMWCINSNGNFRIVMRSNYLAVFSADDTDFQIKPSLKQNEVFLLKAFAGNMYQHPSTGVGLIEYLHGNFENAGLAQKLQKEFDNDKMIVKNAYMNSATGELLLEVEEQDG